MFYHRVLPPPPNLITPLTVGPGAARRDTLLEHRIMPSENAKEAYNINQTLKSPREALPLADQNHHIRKDVQEKDQYELVRIPLRSSARLTGKRTSSQASSEEDTRRSSKATVQSFSTEGTTVPAPESPSQVCLCQPDPKVPRPRNAFILFRQHHQAGVVAQNPGLANPEISKIIGDAWRASPQSLKDHWKSLADEEKARHQRQYPDYRYQPRRAGRNSISTTNFTDPDTQRCLKCGGRSMGTPNHLPTPGVSPGTPISPRAQPPNTPATARIFTRSAYPGSPQVSNSGIGPRPYGSSGNGNMALRGLHRSHPDMGLAMSPDSKRRRFEGGPHNSSPIPRGSVGNMPTYMHPGRRISVNRNDSIGRNVSISIPPRAKQGSHEGPQTGMALAPLQTGFSQDVSTPSKAIEAMVMSIPSLNKVRVLTKCSPPLAIPGPTSPPHMVRGSLIAVEGIDDAALQIVVSHLSEVLERDGEYNVRVFSRTENDALGSHLSINEWLKVIRDYHAESADIIKYITTYPASKQLASSVTDPQNPSEPRNDSEAMDVDKPSSSKETEGEEEEEKQPIPIAIIPRYQLTLTDTAASKVPISDEYSPTDHWQWMATLWRGIIGPDVTIVVRSQSLEQGNGTSPKDSRDNGSSEAKSGAATPPVEVKLAEARAVLLKGEGGGKVSESGLRRVGFEVGEWLRGLGERGKGQV